LVPRGRWTWDEPSKEWVFEDFPPPTANLPKTGDSTPIWFSLIAIACVLAGVWTIRRRRSS
ncbi:MAG: LPXTG cell wall anchor domain-containing protein, partial [Clostridiales bacterium]|nr:LPXTG cell wall anchor domain-containing protein [Clostridiales bacterium]